MQNIDKAIENFLWSTIGNATDGMVDHLIDMYTRAIEGKIGHLKVECTENKIVVTTKTHTQQVLLSEWNGDVRRATFMGLFRLAHAFSISLTSDDKIFAIGILPRQRPL